MNWSLQIDWLLFPFVLLLTQLNVTVCSIQIDSFFAVSRNLFWFLNSLPSIIFNHLNAVAITLFFPSSWIHSFYFYFLLPLPLNHCVVVVFGWNDKIKNYISITSNIILICLAQNSLTSLWKSFCFPLWIVATFNVEIIYPKTQNIFGEMRVYLGVILSKYFERSLYMLLFVLLFLNTWRCQS